jgi:hypothetical protein
MIAKPITKDPTRGKTVTTKDLMLKTTETIEKENRRRDSVMTAVVQVLNAGIDIENIDSVEFEMDIIDRFPSIPYWMRGDVIETVKRFVWLDTFTGEE